MLRATGDGLFRRVPRRHNLQLLTPGHTGIHFIKKNVTK